MFKKYFKKVFGGGDKEVPANVQFYSPLRVALHSTVTLDMVDWLTSIPEVHSDMKLPDGRMTVLAIGITKVDKQKIFNFYLLDESLEEFTLQVVTSPNAQGVGQEFVEGTLYREVRNVTPLTGSQWETEMKHVGDTTFILGDHKYNRVWSDDYDDKIKLISFNEEIIRKEETLHYVNNYVLYKRELNVPWTTNGKKSVELLLVGVEETDETAELVYRVGLNLAQTSIHIQ